jgi:hypothetical protein
MLKSDRVSKVLQPVALKRFVLQEDDGKRTINLTQSTYELEPI